MSRILIQGGAIEIDDFSGQLRAMSLIVPSRADKMKGELAIGAVLEQGVLHVKHEGVPTSLTAIRIEKRRQFV